MTSYSSHPVVTSRTPHPPVTFHPPQEKSASQFPPPPPHLTAPSTHDCFPTYYGTPAYRSCRVMIRAEAASRRQQKKQSYVEPQTQYSEKLPLSLSQEEGTWYEIKEIVAEKRTSYRIAWAGEDPATGQPWKREWVCVTPQLTIPVRVDWG